MVRIRSGISVQRPPVPDESPLGRHRRARPGDPMAVRRRPL